MTNDAIMIQMQENRRTMRGLPSTSPIYQKIKKQNDELGQKLGGARTFKNTRTGGPAWTAIADILAGIEEGADAKFSEIPHGVQKAFVAQETNAIWKIMWGIIDDQI